MLRFLRLLPVFTVGILFLGTQCRRPVTYEFYRQLTLGEDHILHPVDRIQGGMETVEAETSYYRLVRDARGRLTGLQHFSYGHVIRDPIHGIARILVQYFNDTQFFVFYDVDGASPITHDGVYSVGVRYRRDKPSSVVNYGMNGDISSCHHHLAAVFWEYDEHGRRVARKHYGSNLRPTEDNNGIATVTWRYMSGGDYTPLDYMDNKRLHFEDGGPSVLRRRRRFNMNPRNSNRDVMLREGFDRAGRRIERAYLDAAGNLLQDANGVALVRWKYDLEGNIVEEGHFGLDKAYTNDIDGIAAIRWKYAKHMKVERGFFDVAGRLTEDRQTGVAFTRWVYNGELRAEESYLGADGKRREEFLQGIASTQWIYWQEQDDNRWSPNPVREHGEESYYDAQGMAVERKSIGIATVRWVDKSFRELWHDDIHTRIKEWTFHNKEGSLKAVMSERYQAPIAIEQWVYRLDRLKRRYFLDDAGAKVVED